MIWALPIQPAAIHRREKAPDKFCEKAVTNFAENINLTTHDLIVERGAKVVAAPRVSVVIPAYNIAAYVADTLASVFAQTYQSFEVLLINDGSTDTPELEIAIEPFRDSLVYVKKANGGASSARNVGVRLAAGETVAFLDGDDLWLPEFLDSQLQFLEKTGFEMVYADALLFGDVTTVNQTYMQSSASIGAVTAESLLGWTSHVITSGTVVRRDKLIAAGLFDESPTWMRAQDFEMWFRLLKNNVRIGYQTEVLLKYRVRAGSLTGNHIEQAERNLNVLAGIKTKYQLTPQELAVWNKTMNLARAIWHVENGKAAVKNGNYRQAREHFERAAPLYSRPKIALLKFALKFAPNQLQIWLKNYNFER